MKYFALFFMLSLSTLTLAQEENCNCYERLKNLANYCYYQNQNEEGLKVMKKAIHFRGDNTSKLDYIMLTLFYSRNDSLEQTYQSILKGITKGLSKKNLSADYLQEVKEKLGDTYWREIISQYDDYHLKYLASLNLEYRLAVEWLMGSDQRVRASDKTKETLEFVDSLNFYELIELFDSHGFPTMSKHGFGWKTVEAFMLHFSANSQSNLDSVIKVLERASLECACEKGFIAMIKDRYSRYISKTNQSYGVWNLWTEKGEFGEIKEVATVDRRRLEYNLLRLQEQSELDNRKLPDGYLLNEYPENYFCGYQFLDSILKNKK